MTDENTSATVDPDSTSGHPFHDLDRYIALPRVSGLFLSPDGQRLVTKVATLGVDATAYRTALWEIDPAGVKPARRITRGAKGESGAAFTANGDLLFTAARPDPAAKDQDDPPTALWRLASTGGEAELVATRKGGISGIRSARAVDTVVVVGDMLPSALTDEEDEKRRGERKEKKVSAILHTGYPVRYWDSDLGPDQPHLWLGDFSQRPDEVAGGDPSRVTLADLTPQPGNTFRDAEFDISPDGRYVVSTARIGQAKGSYRQEIWLFDRESGERQVLVSDPEDSFHAPVFSPDGNMVAYSRESISTPEIAPRITLHVLALSGGSGSQVGADWDRWPAGFAWLPDSSGFLINADHEGRSPIFHAKLGSADVTMLTADDAAYTDLVVAPDGSAVYAVRASYLLPPHIVRVGLLGDDRDRVTELPGPVAHPELPGTLVDIRTEGEDSVRGWLALPSAADAQNPAPLLLWVHGGPLSSWNAWSWRWNPWLMVAVGYAVLLPDPGLSTGYGQDFIQRGWGDWGGAPYRDLMEITDLVVGREDIDATRTGAMGGSFGGYMANWIAGHTDRFRGIVTHASLWALDQFGPTTDAAFYWGREMSDEMALANSPHRFVDQIATPMLVIHGDKDYRVPIGEGLRLWYELLSRSKLPLDEQGQTPHRLLYFPDENHWILSPQHAKIWYQVVLGFLAEHVLGEQPPVLPELLG